MRPSPPPAIFDAFGTFLPAPEVSEWILKSLVLEGGELFNPQHKHLQHASIGVLWTTFTNQKQMRQILGTAEIPNFRGDAWQKARQEHQLLAWFGVLPDFLITLDAHFCDGCTDTAFCALVEHELYHCAQARDEWGNLAFYRDTGLPKFAIKGHDVEEFVGIVERYGIGDPDGALAQLVKAAQSAPTVARIDIARACGTCMLKSA